jgi:hypothetical protein
MPQVDPELFDRGQFQAELALKASPIAAFKRRSARHGRYSTNASKRGVIFAA